MDSCRVGGPCQRICKERDDAIRDRDNSERALASLVGTGADKSRRMIELIRQVLAQGTPNAYK